MNVVETGPTLYKRGVKGGVLTWFMQLGRDGETWGHRSVSGLENGALTSSGWTLCEGKNQGRRNATTSETQARSEITSHYTKRRDRGYFDDITRIDQVPFTRPMLAQDWSSHGTKVRFPVFVQPKLDGIRCIARRDGLWTRNGKPITSVPHILEDLLEGLFFRHPDLILDGELYNHDLRDNFNEITSIVRTRDPVEKARGMIFLHVYDFVSPQPFSERLRALKVAALPPSLRLVPTFEVEDREHLDRLYGEFIEQGYEGQMIRLDRGYEHKRSPALLKRKEFLTSEFPVVTVEEGNGSWRGHVKRFVMRLPDGRTFGAGVRGSQDRLRDLWTSRANPDWATVRYFTPTPDGVPRFPVVVDYGFGKRED